MRQVTLCLILLIVVVPAFSQDAKVQRHPLVEEEWVSTFSIIAYDPNTNELGVGVQSRAFAAGAIVPYAKASVGAVATQAAANRTYGPKAIALLEQGLTPQEVIKRITDEDPDRDRLQVAVIDAQGRSAVYTGRHVIDRNYDPNDRVHFGGWAGHTTGVNFSAQGNTLASEEVVLAMASAYENSDGEEMAERLMDALEAGQAEGGDIRGMQAAGILVVTPITTPGRTTDRYMDIRVDDHEDPYKELRRVMNVRLSRRHAARANEHAAEGRLSEALEEARKAVRMRPRGEQLHFRLAELYADNGELLNALTSLQAAIRLTPRLRVEASESPSFEALKDMVEFKHLINQ